MKDSGSLHLKVQQMADCFATADPLAEMAGLQSEADQEEAAAKWLALAVLHGINDHAKKITLTRTRDGQVKVTAKYRKTELPEPPAAVSDRVLETVRSILHLESEKGKMPLSLGIRDSSIQLTLKVKQEEDGQKLTIKFPEI